MPIRSIEYNRAFQVTLDWFGGVRRIIIYSRPAGGGFADPNAILKADRDHMVQQMFSGCVCRQGTALVSYAPQEELAAKWIDIFSLDLDENDAVLSHTCAGRYFNGRCRLKAEISRVPIARGWDAVRLSVRNESGFDLG